MNRNHRSNYLKNKKTERETLRIEVIDEIEIKDVNIVPKGASHGVVRGLWETILTSELQSRVNRAVNWSPNSNSL